MIAASLAMASAGLYLLLLAIKAGLALRYARRYPRPPADVDLSAATIVQPILSGDPGLRAALATNLATLSEARFLWLIDDDDPAAGAIVEGLRDAHPAHRIECWSCPTAPAGINPKLFKLERARAHVTGGAFVVLDDDTRLTRVGLGALLAGLDGHTLATGLPCYDDGEGVASRLLGQFVNNSAALTYLPLLAFAEPPTINGMAYALTPASLTAMGGFAPLWHHLADDLAVARRVRAHGGTIVQTPYPQAIATTVRDLRHYRALMHRWFLFALLLLREQPPAWTLSIGLLHGLPPVLLWMALIAATVAIGVPGVPGITGIVGVIGLLAVRAATLILVQRRITGRSRHAPVLSIVAELLQPLHLLHAWCDRRIVWRTRRYTVHANDDFSPSDSTPASG